MKIKRIWFADNRIYGETEDGKVLWQSLLYYKRLLNATPEQRANYEMDDEGIYCIFYIVWSCSCFLCKRICCIKRTCLFYCNILASF